jgi:hypothetical protein
MSTSSVVNSQNELNQSAIEANEMHHPVSKVAASLLSYIFHPIFVPVYIVSFLLYIHPYQFIGFSDKQKIQTLIQAILMYSFFPLITVLLLKALAFIPTIFLKTQKERYIPLIASMTCSFWMWNVWKNLPEYPHEAVVFAFAAFMATIIAWLGNIYMKISLHAISMGVLIGFIFYLAFTQNLSFGIYLSAVLLIAGLVCTARFIVSDHTAKEVYGGLAGGVIAVLIANWFV